MDLNIYVVEWWAKERLSEIREAMLREQIAGSLRPKSSLRLGLGLALIRLGQRIRGDRAVAATPAARTSAAF